MKIFDKLKSALSNTKKSVSNKSNDLITDEFDKEFQSYFDSEIALIIEHNESYYCLEVKDLTGITTAYKSFNDDQKTNFILY